MSSSSNNTFQFGSAGSAGYKFKAPGEDARIFDLPEEKRLEGYVTSAQYELLEKRYDEVIKRMDTFDSERAAVQAAMAIIKRGSANLEKAYADLVASSKEDQTHMKSLEVANKGLEARLAISKAALQNSQAQYKASTVDLESALSRLEAVEAKLAATKATNLRAEAEMDLHEQKIRLEADLVAEYSANLLDAINSAEAAAEAKNTQPDDTLVVNEVDSRELDCLHEKNAKLESEYGELLAAHIKLKNQADALWLGQTVVNWHLVVLLFLFCVWVAAWLLSGTPAGPGAFGFGAFEADGWLARLHARIFATLIDATGGVKVYY